MVVFEIVKSPQNLFLAVSKQVPRGGVVDGFSRLVLAFAAPELASTTHGTAPTCSKMKTHSAAIFKPENEVKAS
jgi:hypothetical protein